MSISRNLAETNPNANRESLSTFISSKVSNILTGDKRDNFVTSLVAAVNNNPRLLECSRDTLVSAALQGAALNLSPSPVMGQFYLVPFKDRKNDRTVCQFQIGYKGYLQLAIRTAQYRRINVIEIRQGELIGWNPMTEHMAVQIIEDDEIRTTLPVVGYYAMFELTNGFQKSIYWSRTKMEQHADRYSQAFSLSMYQKLMNGEISEKERWKYSSFWYADFDAMAFKTMLRHLISKWGIMSTDMQTAIERDMGVLDGAGHVSYVENDLGGDFYAGSTATQQEYTDVDAKPVEIPQSAPEAVANADGDFDPETDFFSNGNGQSQQAKDAAQEDVFTFAGVNKSLMEAPDIDSLGVAASFIGNVDNEAHRAELTKVYYAQRAKLEGV